MENEGATPAAAAQENKEVAPAPAPEASCFKWTTVSEDATFVEVAKEQYRQFKEAPMEQHLSCIKNKVCSVFGDFGGFGGFGGFGDFGGSGTKDNNAPPSVESQ